MEIRQKRLKSLSQIIRHSEALYDVTDFVAVGTNHILQLAYATTQNLFLEEKNPQAFLPENLAGDGCLSTTRSQADISNESMFKQTRPTSWQDAFIRCPRAYLLISTSVDFSLSIGRLPSASGLPEIVRDLPSIGVIARLPWSSEITSFDYDMAIPNEAQHHEYPTSVGSFSSDRRASVEVLTTESESEQSPPQQMVQINYAPSPDTFTEHPMPPRMEDQLQYMHSVGDHPYKNTEPNLDFMDFGNSQQVGNQATETCAFTIPLEVMGHDLQSESPVEQPMFDAYGGSATLSQPIPQAIKAIDSTLFDSFFHEAFEQHWAVS